MNPLKQGFNGLRLLILYIILSQMPAPSFGQCTSTLNTETFQTVLGGTGNNSWGFAFPQFNPTLGTLVAVDIKVHISVNYAFQLENQAGVPTSYGLSVERRDSISNSAFVSPITHAQTSSFGPFSLAASDGTPGSGPDYTSQPTTALLSAYPIHDSIVGSVAGFIGLGYSIFYCNPSTISTVSGGTNYSLSDNVSDTMHFTMTYYYCNTSILASSLTDFSATRENAGTVQLLWQTVNEQTGNSYQVEESADGNLFHEVATENAEVGADQTGHYQYQYGLEGSDHGNIYFRLRETSRQGTVHYSEIRMVELGEGTAATLSVYPNPSSQFINLLFGGHRSNWQVEIYAAHGALVQRNYVAGASRAFIPFKQKLAAGVYFIRALDEQTRQNQVTTFVVE